MAITQTRRNRLGRDMVRLGFALAAFALLSPSAMLGQNYQVIHTFSGGGDGEAAPSPPSPLYRPGGPAQANVQNQGEVRVKVDFGNAPPGTKVQSGASGIAQPPETSVGYSNPLAHGY